MHKIDGDAHVSNEFSGGDPTVPRPPTQVTPAWLNALQDEIGYFISALQNATPPGCDIALDKPTNTQLAAALYKCFMRPGHDPSYGQALGGGAFLIAGADEFGATNSGKQRIILKKEASDHGSSIWLTVNAYWDGAQWVKDNATSPVIAMTMIAGALAGPVAFGGAQFYRYDGAGPFTDVDWRPVNKATALPYNVAPAANHYADTGGGKSAGVYKAAIDGDILLEGCVSNIAGAVADPIATLQAGSRPVTEKRFASSYYNGATFAFCTILIATTGVITTDAAAGAQVRLDGIRFSTVN